MVNSFKITGGSGNLGLQVTTPVREAELVEEHPPEDRNEDMVPPYARSRAHVRIHAFDGLLLAVDYDQMPDAAQAELVAHAIAETQTVYRALRSIVIIQGEGYMLQLPHAAEAGFEEGEPAPVKTAPNFLVVHKQSDEATQVAEELVSMRRNQIDA